MERFGRFTILEPLAQGRIRSYRAWDASTKQVILLHLGFTAEADIPALPAEAVREKGRSDEQPYLITADLPELHDMNQAAAPNAGGEFTRMFQQWKSQAAETKPASAPVNPPAAPAVDPDATRLMPVPGSIPKDKPPVPKVEAQVIRVGPSRAKAADQISNPALSVKPAATPSPGDFTQFFNAPKPSAPQPNAAQAREAPRMKESAPVPDPNNNIPASSPGEFTRMFAPPAGPGATPKPSPPAPVDNQAKDFERLLQSPLAGSGREIDFKALEKHAPVPSAPAPKTAGEFTEMFGKPLSSDPGTPSPGSPPPLRNPAKGAAQNANATVLFEAQPAQPPAAPAGGVSSATPSEYTQMFGRPLSTPASKPGSSPAAAAEPAAKPTAQQSAGKKPAVKAPVGALILIGAALIVIVILLILFLLLRR